MYVVFNIHLMVVLSFATFQTKDYGLHQHEMVKWFGTVLRDRLRRRH